MRAHLVWQRFGTKPGTCFLLAGLSIVKRSL